MSFTLAALPTDLIESLTSYLKYKEIRNLLFCGSKLLNTRFVTGGVRRLECIAKHPLDAPKWPVLASKLAFLEHFKLYIYDNVKGCCFAKLELHTLPKNLQWLSLDFKRSFSLLQLTPVADASGTVQYQELHLLLPNLRRLEVHGADQLHASFFDILPRELDHLVLSTCFHQNADATIVDRLPRTLTHLALSDRNSAYNVPSADEFMSKDVDFPPFLTNLALSTVWSHAVAHRYPATLATLSVMYHNNDRTPLDFAKLPVQLTRLTTTIGRMTPEHVSWLPRSLTSIILNTAHLLDGAQWKELPPRLQTIASENVKLLTDDEFAWIPRTILGIYDDRPAEKRTGACLNHLPPSLTRFRTQLVLTIEQIAFLPRTITELDLPAFPPSAAKVLPPTLKSLACRAGSFDMSCANDLPRSLNSMRVEHVFCASAEPLSMPNLIHFHLKHVDERTHPDFKPSLFLPPSVTILNFGHIPYEWLIDLGHLPRLKQLYQISSSSDFHSASKELFEMLPRNLTCFRVSLQDVSALDGDCIKALPRNLSSFSIIHPDKNSCAAYALSDLANLPPKLVFCQLPLPAGFESSVPCGDLRTYCPPSLVHMYIGPLTFKD